MEYKIEESLIQSEQMKAVKITDEEWAYYEFMDNFSNQICDLMFEQEVTKRELARRIKSSVSFITRVLKSDANLTIATMIKIIDALDGKIEVKISKRG